MTRCGCTESWLSGRSGLRALSLGCGPGDRELEWARLGVFAQITGVDIAPEQTERATRNTKEAGLDDVRLDDTSEAVESSRLIPALHQHFAIVEEHPYGGILHLALHGIAHNFLAEDDPATLQALRLCLSAEDQALVRLGHDFTYAVCSPLAPRADLMRFARSAVEVSGESDPRRASDPMMDPR